MGWSDFLLDCFAIWRVFAAGVLLGTTLAAQQAVTPASQSGMDARPGISLTGVPLITSAAGAQDAEKNIENDPNDSATRVMLLRYYASRANEDDPELLKQLRARHILWLIQHDALPQMLPVAAGSPFASPMPAGGPYWIIYKEGRLGDPVNYAKAKALLEQKVAAANPPQDQRIRQLAGIFLELSDPEAAESLFSEQASKGKLYADVLLGITSRNLRNGFPDTVDDSRRTSPLAEHIMRLIENANDVGLLLFFAGELNRDGSVLYASGKMNWDYTPILKSSVAEIRTLTPDANLSAIHLELPSPGHPWLPPVRIGGRVAEANLIQKIEPRYPEEAKQKLIQGKVAFVVTIDRDGNVKDVRYVSGPQELVAASTEAVKQWRYRPTLLNGYPVEVITEVNINFSMSQ